MRAHAIGDHVSPVTPGHDGGSIEADSALTDAQILDSKRVRVTFFSGVEKLCEFALVGS